MAKFKKIVDENENIRDDLKDIIADCYASIYDYLGKENFERWIDEEQIEDDAKKLIVDYMTENEKEENANAAGFAQGSDAIKFRDSDVSDGRKRSIGIHEVYHIITAHSDRFNRFINEGLTEYMNYLTNNKPFAIGYYENVHTVEFMHKMLGDSFIKAYFLGRDKKFDDKFIQFMAKGKDDYKNVKDDIDSFYTSGERYHDAEHTIEFHSPEAAEKRLEEIKVFLKKMCNAKARQMTENMELYKDGKFDIDNIGEKLEEIVISYPFRNSMEERLEIQKEILGEIIESSYLLNDVKEEEKEARKDEIINKVIEPEMDKNGSLSKYTFHYNILNQTIDEKDTTPSIFQSAFKDAKNMDLVEFVEKVQQIIPKVNASQGEISALASQYAIQAFGNKTDIVLIDQVIKQNLNNKLFEKEREKEKDTIESTYRQIDKNTFVEKRDNRFYIVKINENGEIDEAPFDKSITILKNGKIMRFEGTKSKKLGVYDTDHSSKKIFRVSEEKNEKIIELDNDLNNVKVYGKQDKYATLGALTSKDFLKLRMAQPEIYRIKDSFHEYRIMEDDADNPYEVEGVAYSYDIDKRTRNIDFKKFKSDLDTISKIYIDDEKGKAVKELLIENYLDSTYKTKRKENNEDFTRPENIQQAYDNIKECIINGDFENKELSKSVELLNSERLKQIEENRKYAVVFFSTPEAEKKFRKAESFREYLKQSQLQFKLSRGIDKQILPYHQYYESVGKIKEENKKGFEESTFGLEGMGMSLSVDDR